MDTPISPKVTVAVLAGAITTIVVWLVDLLFHVQIPPPVSAALTVVIMAVAAWAKRDPLRDAGKAAVVMKMEHPSTPVGQIPAVQRVSLDEAGL